MSVSQYFDKFRENHAPKIRVLIFTFSAQAAIQAVGFLSGVLLVRMLAPAEYAYYTLGYSVLAMMSVLCDAGISSALLAIGGRCWSDKKGLGRVYAQSLWLRRRFGLVGSAIALPLLYVLLIRQGSPVYGALLEGVAVGALFWATMTSQLREVILRLHQNLRFLQGTQLGGAVGRLALLVLVTFWLPQAAVPIAVAAGIQWIINRWLWRRASQFVEHSTEPTPEIRAQILKVVRRILPGSIYYAVSAQLAVLILSAYGSSVSVAQYGALGRISQIFSLFSVTFGLTLVPRFARLDVPPAQLLYRYRAMVSGALILGACGALFAYLYPDILLWILGKNYAGLRHELLLAIIAVALRLAIDTSYALSAGRGIIMNPWVSLPADIVMQVGFILFYDVSTTAGVLEMQISTSVIQFAMIYFYAVSQLAVKCPERKLYEAS